MRVAKVIHCVDAHAEGEPSRIVVGGVLDVPGETMLDKMRALERDGDWLRRLVLGGRLGYGGEAIEAPTRREVAAAARPGLLARVAAGCAVAGFGLLTVAEAGWAHGLGVFALLAFIVLGFLAAVPA